MPSQDWPLVGRAAELDEFAAELGGAHLSSRVLAGPMGVGKTRLASEFAALARKAGYWVGRATATKAAARIPLGALAALIPQGGRGPTPSADRGDLLRAAAAALVERAATHRLLLVIDDAHLLDDASATLVQDLVSSGDAIVVATVRSLEPAPDPVVSLWKDGLANRVEIAALDEAAIEELLRQVLGGHLDHGLGADFTRRCEGNVLYLRELVLSAVADGTLHSEDEVWRLCGPISPSTRLIELVDSRLVGLDRAEHDLLELLAFGEPIDAKALAVLSDLSVVEQLERRGLVASSAGTRGIDVRVAHPVYSDVVRSCTPAIRVPTISRALADAFERGGPLDEVGLLRVATLRLDGGGGDPELMLRAAQTARWRYDFVLAERLARAAADAGSGFDAKLLCAQMVGCQGRIAECEGQLAALAENVSDDRQRALVALARLDNEAFFLGRPEQAMLIADDAARYLRDPMWVAEIAAHRSALVLAMEGPTAAAAAAVPLLKATHGRALAWASITAAWSLTRLGRLEEALDAADRGYAAHQALAEPLNMYSWIHLIHRCDTLSQRGEIDAALALAHEHYDRALDDRSVEAQATFALALARMVNEHGHAVTAARFGGEAVDLFRRLGRPQFEQWSRIYLAHALAVAGKDVEAERALRDLDRLNLPPTQYMAVDLLHARAWTAIAGGRQARCEEILEEAVRLGQRNGDLVGCASVLHTMARLGRAAAVATRLGELAATIEGPLIVARHQHTLGLQQRDADLLNDASGQFEKMRADLLAAEAAADAATVLRRRGDSYRATPVERRARRLAIQCEQPATPGLRAPSVRTVLTAAEQKVAALAAPGLSNKAIAEELGLSIRTVETHLQRIYQKLDIAGRGDLRDALGI